MLTTIGEKSVNTKLQKKLDLEDTLQQKLWRLNNLYFIKTKGKTLEPLQLNEVQTYAATRRSLRDFWLKARQLGMTTYGLIDLLDDTIFSSNTNSAILAHQQGKVIKLFEIVKRAFDSLPSALKPRVSLDNRNELYFPELDSKIFITMDTRSETVHNLHVSELAFIRNAEEIMAGTLESVPDTGKITFETTANGMVGYAFDEWESVDSEFQKLFFPWFMDPSYRFPTELSMEDLLNEYAGLSSRFGTLPDLVQRFNLTREQLAFYIRRIHRHKELIVQEYPSTALEAFLSSGLNVFHATDLGKHHALPPVERKYGDLMVWEPPLQGFHYVIGVDPSEGIGGDNAAVCVLNANTGEQVAEYASPNIPPDRLATLVIDVAKWYNRALIVPEMNLATFLSHIKTKYGNIYRREVFDRRTQKKTQALGWRTTGVTKPKLVQDLEEATREEYIGIKSEACLKEMRTFVRTDNAGLNGYGAEGTNKDDRVIALGLAYQGIREVPRLKKPESIAQQKLRDYIAGKQFEADYGKASGADSIARNRKRYYIRDNRPKAQ